MQFEPLLLQSSSLLLSCFPAEHWIEIPNLPCASSVSLLPRFGKCHKRPVECATCKLNHDTMIICIKKQGGLHFSALAKKEASRAPLFGTCSVGTVD